MAPRHIGEMTRAPEFGIMTEAKKTAKKSAKKTTKKAATKTTKKAEPKKPAKRNGKSLVIVESPAKARTINKYLGSDFVVRASMGHIRDLPKGKLGIDLENGEFTPDYAPIKGKNKVIDELKKFAKTAPAVYLAPDLDREGEAIAWHLVEALELDAPNGPDVFRVVFNEITKKAILASFEEPGEVDMDKVEAQQARRVLDRIMGYKLSPLLWKKIAKGLSAGRVQSVAVRLIVEREKEIRAFIKEEYWRVAAYMEVDGEGFSAELKRVGDMRVDKNLDEKAAKAIAEKIGDQLLELTSLEVKPKTRRPTPAFTTSQLQQKASTMLRFSARKTMMVAQQLYEGVEAGADGQVGLITYMRTDSTRVSDDAIAEGRAMIAQLYGDEYVPDKPNTYKTKSKGAQEAHEAVRPTDPARTPDAIKKYLTTDQLKLYTLIWNKFISSQMKPALSNVTTANFECEGNLFRTQGEMEVFDGHLRVFTMDRSDKDGLLLPSGLKQGDKYGHDANAKDSEGNALPFINPTQHFTQPPPRFTEAALVKELEKKGIGRPSTYATIISTIQDRGYVTLEARRFMATELGIIVTDQLVAHFGEVINTEFTSSMENSLDKVESGDERWTVVVKGFYDVFAGFLEKAEKDMRNLKKDPELSERKCEKCDSQMAILYNKRGKFLGCSNYPECKNTMPMDGPRPASEVVETDYTCPKCEKPMVIRDGSRGRFLACTGFPKCKSTASVDDDGKIVVPKETGINCDKCESPMVIKGSKRGPFLACSGYPKCRNAKPLPDELREKPRETGEICEKCEQPMVMKTSRWGKEFLACSGYPECKNTRDPNKAKEDAEGDAADAEPSAESKD